MNMSCKNFPFRLIGCTLFLFVGARTQSAKAVYPDPNVVEAHWRKNPKIFQQTFEMLFSQAESLNLLSEGFPGWFKGQNGNMCTVRMRSDDLPFHTLDDLGKLLCDADLKKIIKVVGSREFLEKVLPEEVVMSIFDNAISGKNFKTKIIFQPRLKKNFFNMFGKGELRMRIEQFFERSEVLGCDFAFAFEKKNRLTVLTDYDVSYALVMGRERRSKKGASFLKKTEQLPDFPWDSSRNAKNRFSTVYAKLRDDLKNNRKKYEDFEICSDAGTAQESLKKSIGVIADNSLINFAVAFFTASESQVLEVCMRPSDGFVIRIEPSIASLQEVDRKELFETIEMHKKPSPNPMIEKYKNKISTMSDILITEDFLKGIFGEEFWNILEHYNVNGLYDSGLSVEFNVSPYGKGLKISYSFNNAYRGNRTEDAVFFRGEAQKWERIDFNYINFVFFYDPEKDEISHVRLQDKLVLNYEHRLKCNTPNGLIAVDNEDSKARCYSFEELLEKSGIHP